MPPFRNPFGRKPPLPNGAASAQDETARPPGTNGAPLKPDYAPSRASSSLSIKSRREEPMEYKLSVYDSGVYLPPSPTEKKSFWQKSPPSTVSSNHRSFLNENEPFSISRESFESYRRSFDISARSPVPSEPNPPRQSLDAKLSRPPRSPLKSDQFERPAPTNEEEEEFEEVGLNDETKQAPKKRGLFARFGDSSDTPAATDGSRPSSSHRGFHLPGRKRGQSGQGAELGQIQQQQPVITGSDDGVIR